MKRTLAALLTVMLLFASCFAESGVDLDDLMAEIEAAETEAEKRTDMICLPSYNYEMSFFTSAEQPRSGLVRITNYNSLLEKLGGEPEVVYAGEDEYFDVQAELQTESIRGEHIYVKTTPRMPVPRELAGQNRFIGKVVIRWAELTAELNLYVSIRLMDAPELIGIAGVPDEYTLPVNQVWPVDVQTDPAGWFCPGSA